VLEQRRHRARVPSDRAEIIGQRSSNGVGADGLEPPAPSL
jgi:hypothetical protein